MANVVLPNIIQGPARVSVGGVTLHVQSDIQVNGQAESWNPQTAFGPMGERHKSRKDTLSFTPVGQIRAALLDYFYAAFLTPATAIGTSILSGAVSIASLAENKTYNWARGGLSKPPGLNLKPTSTAFGSMELTCIGAAATQPTAATYWKAAEGTPGADTTFEEDEIVSDIYSAALGSRSAPYNGMGGMDGFEVNFDLQTKEVPASDVGIANIYVSGLGTSARFAPSNLAESETDVLLGLQNTTAILPGQAYGKAKENLVLTGTQIGWVFTVSTLGAKRSDRVYSIGEHRFKVIEFVNLRTWAGGAPSAMFAYASP